MKEFQFQPFWGSSLHFLYPEGHWKVDFSFFYDITQSDSKYWFGVEAHPKTDHVWPCTLLPQSNGPPSNFQPPWQTPLKIPSVPILQNPILVYLSLNVTVKYSLFSRWRKSVIKINDFKIYIYILVNSNLELTQRKSEAIFTISESKWLIKLSVVFGSK